MHTQRPNTRVSATALSVRFLQASGLAIALLGASATTVAAQGGLVGTWKARVQTTNCANEQALGLPFDVLVTYYADGNTTEVPYTNPAERTESYGHWAKTGKRQFASLSQFGVFDGNGFNAGYQVLERTLSMAKDGKSYAVKARTSRYGLSDELVFSACATGTATRLPEPQAF